MTTTTATADSFRAERQMPFAFGEAEARAAALAWIAMRWLAAPSIARHARYGPIDSIWVPFWRIDAYAVAHWEGPGLRGIVEMDFGAQTVCALALEDGLLMEALDPWPARPLRPRDANGATPRAVAPARVSRDDALALARRRMERELIATARRNQPARVRERMRLLGVEYPREAAGPVLMPAWRFDAAHFGRRWRIGVNGVTGKAAGVQAAR